VLLGISTVDVRDKASPTIVASLPLVGIRFMTLLPAGTHMAVSLYTQDKLCSVCACVLCRFLVAVLVAVSVGVCMFAQVGTCVACAR
jgi:hypothetical protein